MSTSTNPVLTQAAIVASIIALARAILTFGSAFGWWQLDETRNAALQGLIETGIPIVAILAGAFWATRKTTPLTKPRDIDGTPLTRPDNTPSIPEFKKVQEEAIQINDKIDERRIKR